MIPFRKITKTHKPVTEELWVLEMPVDFKISGYSPMSFKKGDYLVIEKDGWVYGKTKEDIERLA